MLGAVKCVFYLVQRQLLPLPVPLSRSLWSLLSCLQQEVEGPGWFFAFALVFVPLTWSPPILCSLVLLPARATRQKQCENLYQDHSCDGLSANSTRWAYCHLFACASNSTGADISSDRKAQPFLPASPNSRCSHDVGKQNKPGWKLRGWGWSC